MGMGEPLHNYDATMKALRILADEHGMAVSPRRVTLSTVGVLPALERLATEPVMPNLAISLHATTEAQRDLLVPINRKYSIEELLNTCRRFPLKRRERITFEYVMLKDVNDTPEDARRLVRLLAGIKAKVNLLPLNEAAGIPFERPSDAAVNRFAQILVRARRHGIGAEVARPRYPRRVRPADYGVVADAAPGRRLAMAMSSASERSRQPLTREPPTASLGRGGRPRPHSGSVTSPHALVARQARRNPDLQIVVGDDERAVLERQPWPDRCRPAPRESAPKLRADLPQPRAPLANHRSRHLARHRRGLSARTVRVGENVQMRQRRRRQISHVRREVVVALSGKPDDQIRPDRRVRQAPDDAVRPAGGSRRACTAGASAAASDRSRAAAAGGSAARTVRRSRRRDRRSPACSPSAPAS